MCWYDGVGGCLSRCVYVSVPVCDGACGCVNRCVYVNVPVCDGVSVDV